MSVTRLRRKRLFALAALAALTVTFTATAATAPGPVKIGPRNEVAPAASDDWFAWSKSRAKRTSPFRPLRAADRPQGLQGQPEEHAGIPGRDRRYDARLPAAPRRARPPLGPPTLRLDDPQAPGDARRDQHGAVGMLRDAFQRLAPLQPRPGIQP